MSLSSQKRDEETGEIVPARYKWAWWGDVMKVWPVMVFFIATMTTGAVAWKVHAVEHDRVQRFMVGDRFTEKDGRDLEARMLKQINVLPRPPEDFRAEFDSLVGRVARIEENQVHHIGEFREFRGAMTSEMRAIRDLLRD